MHLVFRLANECEGSKQERSSFQHNVITDAAREGYKLQVLGEGAPGGGREFTASARGGRAGLYGRERAETLGPTADLAQSVVVPLGMVKSAQVCAIVARDSQLLIRASKPPALLQKSARESRHGCWWACAVDEW